MQHTANSSGVQEEVIIETEPQTMTNKALASPVITTPDLTHGVATHSYGTGHVDWTLSATDQKATILTATGTVDTAGAGAIATPAAGKIFIVSNASAQTITIKATGQTGIAVASTKTAIVRGNGTDFVRVTADA